MNYTTCIGKDAVLKVRAICCAGDAHLSLVRGANGCACGTPRLAQGWQQDPDQKSDDRDHDEQFDQRKPRATEHG